MRIFTFYQPYPGGQQEADNQLLIQIWKRQWSKEGFDPVVIGLSDVAMHPRFKELTKAVLPFPTVNDPMYEYLCYARWAMSHLIKLDEKIAFSDYDVFPLAFNHEVFYSDILTFPVSPAFCGCVNGGPGFWVIGKDGLDMAVEAFCSYDVTEEDQYQGVRHTADQYILRKKMSTCPRMEWMRQYACPGWKSGMVLHIPNVSRQMMHLPKWMEVSQILNHEGAIKP